MGWVRVIGFDFASPGGGAVVTLGDGKPIFRGLKGLAGRLVIPGRCRYNPRLRGKPR